jgi:hypothetical protein
MCTLSAGTFLVQGTQEERLQRESASQKLPRIRFRIAEPKTMIGDLDPHYPLALICAKVGMQSFRHVLGKVGIGQSFDHWVCSFLDGLEGPVGRLALRPGD